jgi:hypothetical protein
MPDPESLLHAVERLSDRFRSMPQSKLVANAGGGAGQAGHERGGADGSRAAEGLALAERLAEAARVLEASQAPRRRMPDAGVFAIGDQIAVAGHDLVAALLARPSQDAKGAEVMDAALRDLAAVAERL